MSFSGELLIAQWIGIYLRDEQCHSASIGARAVIGGGAARYLVSFGAWPVPVAVTFSGDPKEQLDAAIKAWPGVVVVVEGKPNA